MAPEYYFILVYDIPQRSLEIHDFEHDHAAATQAYAAFEREHRNDRGVEVLLVGADSIDTIKTTHSHYFAEHADDLFKHFLEDVEPGGRVIARTKPRVRKRRDAH